MVGLDMIEVTQLAGARRFGALWGPAGLYFVAISNAAMVLAGIRPRAAAG
jgi:hypothetical protein